MVRADRAHAILTRAGTEIGVASTKAFTTQLVALLPARADAREAARPADRRAGGRAGCAALRHLPGALQAALALEPQVIAWARAVREEAARALPRPRPALSDRARRRAQAEGNLVHPRRGVSGRRAEARPARARRRRRCRSSRSRRTTRCWRSSSRNLQEVRARGGELYVVADLDSHLQRERRHPRDPAAASTRDSCRRSCTRFRCSCSRITPRCCAAPTSTSRAISRSR